MIRLMLSPHDRPHLNSFFLLRLDSSIRCNAVLVGGSSDRSRFMDRTDWSDFGTGYSVGRRDCYFRSWNTRSHSGLPAFSPPATGKEKPCLTDARYRLRFRATALTLRARLIVTMHKRNGNVLSQNVPIHAGFCLSF